MTIDELIAGATDRVEIHPGDGKSGAAFELLTLNGERRFLKVLSYDADWIMRCSGNADFWEHKVWQAGLYDRVPAEIDHAMVAMTVDDSRLAMLMRDISDYLIPEGDAVVSTEIHDRFVDHLAAFHAAYWGWTDDIGVSTLEQRVNFFSAANIAREMAAPEPPGPIQAAAQGWADLRRRAPRLADVVEPIRADPTPLCDELRALPQTFIMGDWKMGNLGAHADGRTILLDWAYPGAAPGLWDVIWYVSLNRSRLPRAKEDTFAGYRAALERRGIDTAPWWNDAVRLCLTGVMAMMAWEKALGDDDELAWWENAVVRGGL